MRASWVMIFRNKRLELLLGQTQLKYRISGCQRWARRPGPQTPHRLAGPFPANQLVRPTFKRMKKPAWECQPQSPPPLLRFALLAHSVSSCASHTSGCCHCRTLRCTSNHTARSSSPSVAPVRWVSSAFLPNGHALHRLAALASLGDAKRVPLCVFSVPLQSRRNSLPFLLLALPIYSNVLVHHIGPSLAIVVPHAVHTVCLSDDCGQPASVP